MLVVADSSPINILIRIDHIDILPLLFGHVLIPPEVHAELMHNRTPAAVRSFVSALPSWMQIRQANSCPVNTATGRGEEAAISLAAELHADALLIDERDGRRAAVARNIHVIGTLGLLERAALDGHLNLANAIDRLRLTDFRIDPKLIQAALNRANPPDRQS